MADGIISGNIAKTNSGVYDSVNFAMSGRSITDNTLNRNGSAAPG